MEKQNQEFGNKATATHTYRGVEIYTKNPETGDTGWDIEFVDVHTSGKGQVVDILTKEHPHFDCIILF